MPWLMEKVEDQLEKTVASRTMLDGLIREVVAKRLRAFAAQLMAISEPELVAVPSPAPATPIPVVQAEVKQIFTCRFSHYS